MEMVGMGLLFDKFHPPILLTAVFRGVVRGRFGVSHPVAGETRRVDPSTSAVFTEAARPFDSVRFDALAPTLSVCPSILNFSAALFFIMVATSSSTGFDSGLIFGRFLILGRRRKAAERERTHQRQDRNTLETGHRTHLTNEWPVDGSRNTPRADDVSAAGAV
jgi:hypothetical protein